MNILFTSVAAFGHLHPIMPLALAAKAAGDDVVVATGPDLADWVPACGLSHALAGRGGVPTWSEAEQEQLAQHGPLLAYHLFTTFHVPPMARDQLELCRTWRPDLIVHEETEFAAPLVARLLDVPVVTHSYSAPARPENERATMLELLGPIWADFGATEPRITGDVYLDACPTGFQTDAVRSIPNARAVRPTSFDGPRTSAPDWLDDLERPAAYVTFGTVARFAQPAVLQQAIDVVAPQFRGLVVTTGPNDPGCVAAPDGVFIEQYLEQSSILPSVDVVVSHGGAGTTLGAIEQGLPHVVMPQQPYSQQRNAERVDALGIGRHVPKGDYDALGAAVRQVLDDSEYGQNVAALRATFDALPPPPEVLEGLRQLAD